MSERDFSKLRRVRVSELIDHLKTLDQNLCVFTRGYEGGVCDAALPLEEITVKLDENTEWFYGPHEEINAKEVVESEAKIAMGYLI